MSTRTFGAAAALVLAIVPLAAQQTPVRDTVKTAAPVAGTSTISGIVTSDDGSRPIRFAYIVVIGTGTGTVKVTSSDANGRFSASGLPADRYTIGASKPPYLGTVAGARRPARPGTPIAVADGQHVSNVAIRMPMGASISGVVTDERGLPGAGAALSLLQWRLQAGERVLAPVPGVSQNLMADDRGRYRFHGLPPGEYVIAAMRPAAPASPARAFTAAEIDAAMKSGAAPSMAPATPASPPVRYVSVYYPGTSRAVDAQPVAVATGDERINIDFRLEEVRTSRVEGMVVGSDGQPVARAPLIVTTPVGSLLSTAQSTMTGPDGRFTVAALPPGPHIFSVTGTGPLAGQYARMVVDVAGADMFGVSVVMRPALTLTGRLLFDGAPTAPSVAGRRVPMRAWGGASGLPAPQVGATDASGAFTVTNLAPGRWLIGGPLSFGPTSDTMTWALQAVIVDGRDVTDLPIEIGETPPREVVVSYTDRWQELSGRLQSQSGAPVSEHTMVVFPENRAYWIQGSRRIVTARPGTDGRFVLSGQGPTTLPPGRYLLAAVTDISRDEQFDPAFLAQLVPAAIPLALAPGEKKVQDVGIK
jgi:hypothetical protein